MQRSKVDKITPYRGIIVTDTSQNVLADNQYRRYLLIQNQSEKDILYIEFDIDAIVGSLAIGPGEPYLVDAQIMHTAIHAIAPAGKSIPVYIVEGESRFWGGG